MADLLFSNGAVVDFGSRCQVCGRHISQLKPFGGRDDDPLIDIFSGGELLLKTWRREAPYDEAADRAWKEFRKEGPEQEDPLPRFIFRYGKETAIRFYWWEQLYGSLRPSWECRDCIVLDEAEYFDALDKRSKGQDQIESPIGSSGEGD